MVVARAPLLPFALAAGSTVVIVVSRRSSVNVGCLTAKVSLRGLCSGDSSNTCRVEGHPGILLPHPPAVFHSLRLFLFPAASPLNYPSRILVEQSPPDADVVVRMLMSVENDRR